MRLPNICPSLSATLLPIANNSQFIQLILLRKVEKVRKKGKIVLEKHIFIKICFAHHAFDQESLATEHVAEEIALPELE